MNLTDNHHTAVFDAIQKEKARLRNDGEVFEWAAKRRIDRTQFEATYKSFGIIAQVGRAKDRTQQNGVEGAPSFVVNGKNKASLGSAHDAKTFFVTLDRLITTGRLKK